MDIIKTEARKPAFISEVEYEMVTVMFAQGMSREQVIKKLNFDRNWYYARLKKDPQLQLAERNGTEQLINELPKDIVIGMKKSILGHTKTVKKKVYEMRNVTDENGIVTQEKVLIGETEEERYYPPQSGVLNAAGKQTMSLLKDSESSTEIEKKIMMLDPADLDTIYKIVEQKILNDG